jgi:hypothetical protein
VKWFKRLFGKPTKQESQDTSAAEKPAEPVETPAEVVEKASEKAPAEESATPAATEAVEDVRPAEKEPSDPALSQLDSERTAAELSAKEDKPAVSPAVSSVVEPTASVDPVTTGTKAPGKAAATKKPSAAKVSAPKKPEPPVAAQVPAPVTPATTAEEPPAAEKGPFGPNSAKPLADGGAPGEEYTVKGKRSSKLFHTADSPYFGRTKADVWFKTAADAESAGFAAWNHKKKAPTTK